MVWGFFFSLHTAAPFPLYLTCVTPDKSYALQTLYWKANLTHLIGLAIKLVLGESSENLRLSETSSKTYHGSRNLRFCGEALKCSPFQRHFTTHQLLVVVRGRLCSSSCPWFDLWSVSTAFACVKGSAQWLPLQLSSSATLFMFVYKYLYPPLDGKLHDYRIRICPQWPG